ncbi:hypothetical protein JOB18_005047 [Solea senegalensis]|uniref:Uncharacterized protein n=1 Tax=Solea senegalensis TaxID=28829 RepID=A0AAV6Q2Q1_SOLSE|nr:hypothetical protein JOB18_005047 [Solea senegalensis]
MRKRWRASGGGRAVTARRVEYEHKRHLENVMESCRGVRKGEDKPSQITSNKEEVGASCVFWVAAEQCEGKRGWILRLQKDEITDEQMPANEVLTGRRTNVVSNSNFLKQTLPPAAPDYSSLVGAAERRPTRRLSLRFPHIVAFDSGRGGEDGVGGGSRRDSVPLKRIPLVSNSAQGNTRRVVRKILKATDCELFYICMYVLKKNIQHRQCLHYFCVSPQHPREICRERSSTVVVGGACNSITSQVAATESSRRREKLDVKQTSRSIMALLSEWRLKTINIQHV